MEQWKKIIYNNYELNYSISNYGNVRNDKYGNFLKPSFQNGYYSVRLSIQPGVGKHFRVNRLVANAFIDNPENKEYVNHIDGNTANNFVENLEWVTPSENSIHAYKAGLRTPNRQRKVNQYNLNGNYMLTFESLNEAARQLGIQESKISLACSGERITAGEYQWRYYDEYNSLEDIPPVEVPRTKKHCVGQYDINDNLIAIYESYRAAAIAVEGTPSAISRICSGAKGLHTHKGYKWKIVDDIVQYE